MTRINAIGLSGFASSGKTTVALYLEQRYGFQRQHIAEPLRDMLRALLRRWGYAESLIDRYLVGDLKEAMIPELGITSRRAQITLGTEWGREQVHPDLWAKLWSYEAAGNLAMNDSVRFPNEELAIRRIDGITIIVIRSGTGPAAFKWGWLGKVLFRVGVMWGVHDSERTDRLRPDYVVTNNGSLADLYRQIDAIMLRCGNAG